MSFSNKTMARFTKCVEGVSNARRQKRSNEFARWGLITVARKNSHDVSLDKEPSRSSGKERGMWSFVRIIYSPTAATISNWPFHPSHNFVSILFSIKWSGQATDAKFTSTSVSCPTMLPKENLMGLPDTTTSRLGGQRPWWTQEGLLVSILKTLPKSRWMSPMVSPSRLQRG